MTGVNLNKLQILDCTIRDGGHLNDWQFDKRIVKELYRNLSRTGVDFIEIGLRNIQKKDLGIWYSTPEELINELFKYISGASIALMIDDGKFDLTRIPKAKDSLVKLYRIACHRDRVLESLEVCEAIKAQGYLTSVQLMGIVGYTAKDFEAIIEPLSKSSVDYVYFADSYGSLFPHDIKKYIDWLKPTGKKIGFHPHNNLQLAFANTLEAIRCGIDIVDGTVYGMGRGAGNLPLEVLIVYLEKTMKQKKYNVVPTMDLIDRFFLTLHKELKWGYNLPYMLSGATEVHPNYSKALMELYQYSADDMVKVLEIIKHLGVIGYNQELMDNIINSGFIAPATEKEETRHNEIELAHLKENFSVTYKNRHEGRDFLILANGNTLQEYKKDIGEFIRKFDPIVMGANFLGGLFKPHYHAFSNKKRFMTYVDSVDPESTLLLSTIFDDDFVRDYTKRDFERIVHLNRISSNFEIVDDVVTSNCRTISTLLIAVAIVMGAKRIFIAGMDGYKDNEHLASQKVHFYQESAESKNTRALLELHNWNERLLQSINSYLLSHNKEGLHIITPTSHNNFYSSIYNYR